MTGNVPLKDPAQFIQEDIDIILTATGDELNSTITTVSYPAPNIVPARQLTGGKTESHPLDHTCKISMD